MFLNFLTLALNNHTAGYLWKLAGTEICYVLGWNFFLNCTKWIIVMHFIVFYKDTTLSRLSLLTFILPLAPLSPFQSWLPLGLAFGQTSNQNLCISFWVCFFLEKTYSYKNHDSLTSWGQLPDQYQSEWEAHDGCPFGLKEKQQRHIKLS